MGMESANSGPTKESQQEWIDQLKTQKKSREDILKLVEDRPIEPMYDEGKKNREIQDLQTVIDNYDTQIKEAEQILSSLK